MVSICTITGVLIFSGFLPRSRNFDNLDSMLSHDRCIDAQFLTGIVAFFESYTVKIN